MHIKRLILVVSALVATATTSAVMAQSSDLQQQYQLDLQRCDREQSLIDRDACKKEAAAARQAAQSNLLGNGADVDYQANKEARCMALPETQRADCLRLHSGQDVRVKGSVNQGGILRETTIIMPAPQPVVPQIQQQPLVPEPATPSPIRP